MTPTPRLDIPARLSTFVGRSRELRDLARVFSEGRLVTLTGPGGCGKTRLALEFAATLDGPGRPAFVDLAAVTDPALVPAAIASVMGVREQAAEPLEETLAKRLRRAPVVLILDNLEQIRGAGAVAARLLVMVPGLRILATSRVSLHVDGEREFPVRPLELPDGADRASLERLAGTGSVRLFVERAKAIDPSFELGPDNAHAIAAICTRLDGLPLAIELAAARMRLFSPSALLARLDRALPLLTAGPGSGTSATVARQRSLRDAIAWSYELLDDADRRVFVSLSVFAESFDVAAAEAVVGAGTVVGDGTVVRAEAGVGGSARLLATLERLVDQSLLTVGPDDDGEPRFRMLVTIREFAAEQVTAAERPGLQDRQLAFLAALAEQAEAELRGPEQRRWLRRLIGHRADIRSALSWADETGDHASLGRLLGGLGQRFWYEAGGLRDGLRWLELALAVTPAGARIRGRLLQRAAWFATEAGRGEYARELFAATLTDAAEDDHDSRFEALVGVAHAALFIGDPDPTATDALLERAIWHAERAGFRGALVEPFTAQGWLARSRGDLPGARARFGRAVEVAREAGDTWGLASSLFHRASLDVAVGDITRARDALVESLRFAAESGDHELHAWAAISLAGALIHLGELSDARRHLEEGAAALQRSGNAYADVDMLESAAAWLDAVRMPAPARDARAAAAGGRTTGDDGWAELDQAVAEAMAAVRAVDLDAVAASAGARRRDGIELTPREREVLALVASGMSDGQIAERLFISKKTASVHVANIKGKLGAASRVEVATMALRQEAG